MSVDWQRRLTLFSGPDTDSRGKSGKQTAPPNLSSRFTLFSDPVHGFVSVPRGDLFDLIGTSQLQRLRRIRQLGVGYMVFPGAEHSRFGHALGAMALMKDALHTLMDKGTDISPEEVFSGSAAALLHDIGHGPFSHTLEDVLIHGFHHETMSRRLIVGLNEKLEGRLELALRIFDGAYERPFLHELVSSQLDMDRLDYLRRDSYYTGVVEGRVGIDRIVRSLLVTDDQRLGVNSKGLYAVESFLIARRLMYWQVYLHRAVVAGDRVLRAAIQRSRDLIRSGDARIARMASPLLAPFLTEHLDVDQLSRPEIAMAYATLDDTDILYSLKRWRDAPDPILSDLAGRFLDRRFFRTQILRELPKPEATDEWRGRVLRWLVRTGLSSGDESDAVYYTTTSFLQHRAYHRDKGPIQVVSPGERASELTDSADSDAIASLAIRERKPYVCGPKEVPLRESGLE
jgi:uncharacterized protein